MRSIAAVGVCLALGGGLAAAGDRWTEFRGPSGTGHSDSSGLPREWSETKNVAWKTAIHGRGWSSPVVLGSQVWLTTATRDGRELSVLALDRDSGRALHDILLFRVERPEDTARYNSFASPTPVIEEGEQRSMIAAHSAPVPHPTSSHLRPGAIFSHERNKGAT